MFDDAGRKDAYLCLHTAIPTIDHNIAASHVAGSIGRQEQIGTLQLAGLAFTAHRNLAMPDALDFGRDEVGDLRGHVAWRDTVYASELHPLDGERATEVDHSGFGCVVLLPRSARYLAEKETSLENLQQIAVVEC